MLYEPFLKKQLVRVAKAYAKGTQLALATVGRDFLNDSRFFDRVSDGGGGFTVRTYDRVICWFSQEWPADLEWPSDVPRPSAREASAFKPRENRKTRKPRTVRKPRPARARAA